MESLQDGENMKIMSKPDESVQTYLQIWSLIIMFSNFLGINMIKTNSGAGMFISHELHPHL